MTSTRPARKPRDRPREDHGFFGPDSVTWRVWGHPTALTVGFQRSVVVEELDPFLLAAVAQQNKVRYAPRARYDGTIAYFATIAFGDGRAAIEASEMLYRVHGHATGTEPVSGLPYSANSPTTQLWILITGWHSVLYAYERFGPGPLSAEDDKRYWAECAIAAELQTCDPAQVPRSREEVRDYFAAVRPGLCITEDTRTIMAHLLDPSAVTQPKSRLLRPLAWVVARTMRAATLSTLPRWVRRLSGFRQSSATGVLVRPFVRLAMRAARPLPLQMRLLDAISPSVRAIVEPAFTGVQPIDSVVVTPDQARTAHGRLPSPASLAADAGQRLDTVAG